MLVSPVKFKIKLKSKSKKDKEDNRPKSSLTL
ncbi:MAG: hypothetical protein ACI8ZQ_000981, partial [Bacteroidia bacterium]